MIGINLIEEIKDLFMRLNQEEMSSNQIKKLNNSTIEELEESKRILLAQMGPEWYEFD